MSQDLLAEFGSFTISDSNQSNTTTAYAASPTLGSTHTQSKKTPPLQDATPSTINGQSEDAWAEDDEDDFGDFEVANDELGRDILDQPPPSNTITTKSKPAPPKAAPRAAPASKPTISKKAESAKQISSDHPFANNADILFDAEYSDEEGMFEVIPEPKSVPVENEDDDFGDFEGTLPPTKTASRSKPSPVAAPLSQFASFDLLGFDDGPEQIQSPTTNGTKAQAKPPPKKLITRKITQAKPPPKPAPVNKVLVEDDDNDFAEWDDFESVPKNPTSQSPKTEPTSIQASAIGNLLQVPTDLIGNLLSPAPNPSPPAPANIPPPSLLLTIFPPLLKQTSTHLLHPLSTLSPPQKPIVLLSPSLQTFFRNYLCAAQVLAHVIAGRKNRWKRDKFLAQSMRIGPSVSGRSGGMKLAGVDANEARREEAEVEDVLRVWREQVGRLRSVVTAVAGVSSSGSSGGHKKALPSVPEIAAVMPIRVAKTSEGGVVSTAACAFCGLKREERVAKVDVEVEDSFGEWWIEGGTNMHLSCWNFWNCHKDALRGR
ncbi:hypothetical protein AAFC00_004566 [Neodothiora populina]|uniref:Uncharacterized protein n=1 Tax=Neodothiora populina TaxID=2781224 RepID=A0ABR3P2S3_9PEZI